MSFRGRNDGQSPARRSGNEQHNVGYPNRSPSFGNNMHMVAPPSNDWPIYQPTFQQQMQFPPHMYPIVQQHFGQREAAGSNPSYQQQHQGWGDTPQRQMGPSQGRGGGSSYYGGYGNPESYGNYYNRQDNIQNQGYPTTHPGYFTAPHHSEYSTVRYSGNVDATAVSEVRPSFSGPAPSSVFQGNLYSHQANSMDRMHHPVVYNPVPVAQFRALPPPAISRPDVVNALPPPQAVPAAFVSTTGPPNRTLGFSGPPPVKTNSGSAPEVVDLDDGKLVNIRVNSFDRKSRNYGLDV